MGDKEHLKAIPQNKHHTRYLLGGNISQEVAASAWAGEKTAGMKQQSGLTEDFSGGRAFQDRDFQGENWWDFKF